MSIVPETKGFLGSSMANENLSLGNLLDFVNSTKEWSNRKCFVSPDLLKITYLGENSEHEFSLLNNGRWIGYEFLPNEPDSAPLSLSFSSVKSFVAFFNCDNWETVVMHASKAIHQN
ncbi:hypothetical protein [Cohaesibacter celericrescens]|uniref:Uncharacterized protein n=1 Tax=Cohaesibacter celericrescens TaxID=2067669 RepID=A0A2N5XQ17_9HYPH|nr:hypothetical protein [Cohaesibacter celericrescens]PLW76584.1 hypothetical protein C0081_13835 [Cohaesibacter celericrescens]